MSPLKSVYKPSVVPVYAVAAVWLLYTLIFGLHSLGQILLCTAISAAAHMGLKSKFPGQTIEEEEPQSAPDTGDKQLDELIVQGRAAAARIRQLNAQIPDETLTATLNGIQDTSSRILARLEADKSQLARCRQFLNYYLPTTVKLLEQYVRLQDQGQRTGNIDQAMSRIEAMLEKIREAFSRQLDSLFESEMVDVTAEIAVMEQLLQSSGLTGRQEL